MKDEVAVQRLVRLLASPDKPTRAYAMMCVATMVEAQSVRRVLLKTACIPPLLDALKPEEELVTQERASKTIAKLAEEYSFKIELQKQSAHKPLLQLLQSPDPDVQRNSLKALELLLEHYQCRPEIREAGGIPLLVSMLVSEYPLIQELALKSLSSCMHDASCRNAFRECDGLTQLVAFIGKKEYSSLHNQAVEVLALCLEDTVNMVAIQSSGCLKQLLTSVTESTVPEMKRNAALALAKAANNSVNQKLLHEQEVEKTFTQLLSSEDDGVCIAGAEGIGAMATLSSAKQTIGQEGGLEALVSVLGKENGGVRNAAIQALVKVIDESPANTKQLAECAGIEALVQLLVNSETTCRVCAAQCIITMATDDALRTSLAGAGAVGALIQCLSFQDSQAQTEAAQAIASLACDAIVRDQFVAGGGVAPLIKLLQSSHDSVRRSATWALSECARGKEAAEEACKLGALGIVQGLCSAPGKLGGFARAALTSLVDSSYAAKYWITGRLSQTDVLYECEFFDAGLAISSSGPFVPLAELISRPLNLNLPVLTVNLLAMPAPPPPPPPAEEVAAPSALDGSQSTVSISNRSKSRNIASKAEGKGKKAKNEKETESCISEESEETVVTEKLPGLLAPDPGLWAHISYAKTNILTLPHARDQVQQLARYVSDKMGGPVQKTGTFGFELSASEIQQRLHTNLVPLGEVEAGVFQHRALLFKVLCDQMGIGCSLVRGEYGRHWNEVTLVDTDGSHSLCCFVVDLMFDVGRLLPVQTPEAAAYQHF